MRCDFLRILYLRTYTISHEGNSTSGESGPGAGGEPIPRPSAEPRQVPSAEPRHGPPRRESGRGRPRALFELLWRPLAVLLPAVAVVIVMLSWPVPSGGLNSDDRLRAVPDREEPVGGGSDGGSGSGWLAAELTKATVLRARPRGRALARVSTRTEFRSQRVLSVVRRQPGWLGVVAPQLPNRHVGWIPAKSAKLSRVVYSLHADLSEKRLTVRRDGRTLRRLPIAVGLPGSSTPLGRFSVTDRLRITDPQSPYGCCALALSAHQPNVPPGWTGGDRIAIHDTRDLGSIGRTASLGCMRALTRDIRRLMRTIPLGTPVFVKT